MRILYSCSFTHTKTLHTVDARMWYYIKRRMWTNFCGLILKRRHHSCCHYSAAIYVVFSWRINTSARIRWRGVVDWNARVEGLHLFVGLRIKINFTNPFLVARVRSVNEMKNKNNAKHEKNIWSIWTLRVTGTDLTELKGICFFFFFCTFSSHKHIMEKDTLFTCVFRTSFSYDIRSLTQSNNKCIQENIICEYNTI